MNDVLNLAASDKEVKAAIEHRISRERIGHVTDLMIFDKRPGYTQPVKAMTFIAELELFRTVFRLPPGYEQWRCVSCLDSVWRLLNLIGCSSFPDDQKRLCLFAALFLPLNDTIYSGNRRKKIPLVDYIIRDSLKLKASDAETVISLHTAAKKILTGLLLREIKECWRVALLLSMLLHPVDILSPSTSFSNERDEVEKRSVLFKTVENAVRTQGLEKVWEMKPLVNGKEIMYHLDIKSGGPDIGEWQQKLLQWQLACPSGTAEECLDWMMKQTVSKRARTNDQ
ncbi:hypothetical protein K7X08_031427 [Anisodus acutangulus]|uniref:Uncharacterized protein n=1 Tax=Anisodus acutangulus TaxID=402998 RepID=A0A9Q1ML40_9SOLA|nr:hypothetical protein K7X08_031427 [Anisodus acutangulus]